MSKKKKGKGAKDNLARKVADAELEVNARKMRLNIAKADLKEAIGEYFHMNDDQTTLED